MRLPLDEALTALRAPLTDPAQAACRAALYRARHLPDGQYDVYTEHLLLALLDEGGPRVRRVLESHHVDVASLPDAIARQSARSPEPPQDMDAVMLSPRLRRVLDLAVRQAQRAGKAAVDREHLLLGLVEDGDGLAAQVLRKAGLPPLDTLVREIRDQSDESGEAPA